MEDKDQPIKTHQEVILDNPPAHGSTIYKNYKKNILLIIGVPIILVVVSGFVYAGYQSLFKRSSSQISSDQKYNYNQQNPDNAKVRNNSCSTDFGMIEAPRSSADGAFTSAITNTDAIRVISPGKLVGDARFTYLWIKNGQSIPIFAPADGVLVQIFYKTRSDLSSDLSKPDYDLVFYVDCHTMYRINHITDPIEEIASQRPISQPLELKPGSGFNNNDTKPKQNIIVKAGQQIGTTTGTPSAHNFDFGIFVDQQSVCPYDKFKEPVRSNFLALLGNTVSPINGATCDVSGMY